MGNFPGPAHVLYYQCLGIFLGTSGRVPAVRGEREFSGKFRHNALQDERQYFNWSHAYIS